MFEFLGANELVIIFVLALVFGIIFACWLPGAIRRGEERRAKERQRIRKLAEEKAERASWLAGALEHRNKAIAARDAREKASEQKAAPRSPAPPHGDPEVTSLVPPPSPTLHLVDEPRQKKSPSPDEGRTVPLGAASPTLPLPKPQVKRAAAPRPAPPKREPAGWEPGCPPVFRNVRALGSGGFADVFYGEDEAGVPQAIKVLRKSGLNGELAEQLFRREVRMLAVLRSPSIPRIISTHLDAQRPYFTMDYIDGVNLSDHVAKIGAMTNAAELLDLANSTADALSEIHDNNFLHRDIKPSNVMVPRSGFKLIDLGIGKDLQSPTTSGANRMGTLSFMAPELMNGGQANAATDVFSWGAMIGYAMTGLWPYGAHPEHVLMRRVADGRLDGRFLGKLEEFKLHGVTHQMLAYVAGVSIRTDPALRDLNFREVLRVLRRLHRDPSAVPSPRR